MKRTLNVALIVGAVIAFATLVVSSTLDGGASEAVHTMPSGQTMPGDQMP